VSALYSRDILRLAVASADFPPLSRPDARVEQRAPLCGSRIVMDVRLGTDGRVNATGFELHACAIGQAAAALFARHAPGRAVSELGAAARALGRWLEDAAAPLPDWPDIEALAAVRNFPARRGAALLAFAAAAEAAVQANRARVA
jgi:NifU-like protein involved in Fe-S cluster formation